MPEKKKKRLEIVLDSILNHHFFSCLFVVFYFCKDGLSFAV